MRDARGRRGVRVVARDEGPGIADLERALTDGYTTGGGLGLGLPGARRLVDEFDIETAPGEGHDGHAGQVDAQWLRSGPRRSTAAWRARRTRARALGRPRGLRPDRRAARSRA